MLQNYLKIASRNLLRHKYYSIINVLGLSVGMTCAIILLIYVQYEMSYDHFFANAGRIYRLNVDVRFAQNAYKAASTTGKFAPTLMNDFPEIEKIGRIHGSYRYLVEYEDKKIYFEDLCYADSTITQIFDFDFIAGNPETALEKPGSIIINETQAKALFGTTQDLLGKTILIHEERGKKPNFVITGVIRDIPKNAHFTNSGFISFNTLDQKESFISQWGSSSDLFTYLLMPEGYDIATLEAQMPAFIQKNMYRPEWEKLNMQQQISFQPLDKIHLYSQHLDGESFRGNINYVYIFTVTAFFILIIASINYINMATARSLSRAKEIGVRKVMGAYRTQLIQQFMLEAFILSFFSLLVSLCMVELLLPQFSTLVKRDMRLNLLDTQTDLLLLIVFALMGILSGLYPANVLSGFNPSLVLKGKFSSNSKGASLRKALIVFQFTVSITMIIGTIVVYSQLEFMRKNDLGLNKDQVMGISLPENVVKKADLFKEKLSKNPSIKAVTISSNQIGRQDNWRTTVRVKGDEGDSNRIQVQIVSIDKDYIPTLEVELASGENFSGNVADSARYVIINETFVKRAGWEDPIGKKISYYGNENPYTVIGVVKDFHLRSLHHQVMPMLLFYNKFEKDNVFIKINPQNKDATIQFIKETYEELDNKYPFEYSFLDKNFEEMYETDTNRSNLFFAFAIVAIFIASLGLSGLVTFYVEQRTKEIGIRKVLGASVANILALISKDFIILVTISSIIACPLAYYMMSSWLQDFIYKISLGSQWYVFLLVVLASMLITILAVTIQAFKAAITNPVNVLKNE